MAIRTIDLSLTLAKEADAMTDSDINTLAVGAIGLAKAVRAFAVVKGDSVAKRQIFANIASVARITYDDAVSLSQLAIKNSALRSTIRALRSSIVQRIRNASVVHDASLDSASIVKLDKVVSALDVIAEHTSRIVRVSAVQESAAA